ncbi:MAG: GIY-YIG nuclease family protein [Acetobacteraceae bacterium]|nr:GIY-YIG nuclease family protein [Acetobacteraceae bacterium]
MAHASLTLERVPFVVVDLETTGGSAVFDRVMEVAAIRVQGGVIQDRVEHLVEPGKAIPPFVSRMTGISAGLLRGKPSFETLLPELGRLFEGAVLVAHNASFDANFLSHAFSRAGIAWDGERLCTLRLARRLIPGLHSYRLDSLCAFLGYPFVQRHRAGPDAEATLQLLQHILERAVGSGCDTLARLLRLQHQPVSRARHKGRVDEAQVASLPTTPGVYLLKDHHGQVVYVGKSVNVRQRVRTHLRPSGTARSGAQPRLRRRLPHIADVEAIETRSELEALLLESKLVKRYLPEANSLLRDYHDYPFIKMDLRDPYPRLEATRERPGEGAVYFGPFRRAGAVSSAVVFLNEQLGLRQCSGHIRPGQPACALLEMGRCLGPCIGAAPDSDYRQAVGEALGVLRGTSTDVLQRAAQRRDALGEQLRFEEAADLRDSIRSVEQVVGVQQRLAAFADRNVALVTPDRHTDRVRVLLVRAGRLAEQVSLPVRATPSHLRYLLRRVFTAPGHSHVSKDELDDLLIVDAWLRHHAAEVLEVGIEPHTPEAAVGALREAIVTCAARTAANAAGATVASGSAPELSARKGRRRAAEPSPGGPEPAPPQPPAGGQG